MATLSYCLAEAPTATLSEAVYKAITISFELQKSVVAISRRSVFVTTASLERRLGLTARRAMNRRANEQCERTRVYRKRTAPASRDPIAEHGPSARLLTCDISLAYLRSEPTVKKCRDFPGVATGSSHIVYGFWAYICKTCLTWRSRKPSNVRDDL